MFCVLVGVVLSSCTAHTPIGEGTGSNVERSLAALSIPLDVRDFKVVSADGHRGVFLKLSRLPDGVTSSAQSDPARIIVEIKGPTGAEAPEEKFPGGDTLVTQVRVARNFGALRVTLDLQGNEPPAFTVHQMADWVMIRLAPAHSGRAEPAGADAG